jgi:hypothetical protein
MMDQLDNAQPVLERGWWKPRWKLEKFHNCPDHETAVREGRIPDEVMEVDGNVLLNGGITVLLKLLAGASATAYNNANSNIAVGNSSTAENATQTNLQGTIVLAGMNATYPQVSGQTITWQASFGSSAANFNWLEVGVQNGTGSPADPVWLLNRKQQNFGTKVSGSTWTMTLSLTIS